MRYMVCLLDAADRGISEGARWAYEVLPYARGLEFAWRKFDHAAVLTAWDDRWGDPLVVTDGEWVGVGVVRLDNRAEVERWVEATGKPLTELTDLELMLRLVARTGARRIRDILGDFAFVVWHYRTQAAVAATDALGVKKLFYAERNGLVSFASRAEALAQEDRYEPQYLAERIANCSLTPGLTVYEGVQRLPAGTVATLERGRVKLSTYWSPEQFETLPFTRALKREAAPNLRNLLVESVTQRLAGRGEIWAQLSGGLDSSSVVSTAQWLVASGEAPHGVAGTVTFVDWQGTDADERDYADAVTARWLVCNEAIIDPPLWVDRDTPPPWLDQPYEGFAFHPRDRRLCEIVRQAGGRMLLSGFGSDEIFGGNALFLADWLVRGRVWPAVREAARWAARGRVSFWKLAYDNALLPLVPRCLRRPTSFNDGRLFPWIAEGAARRYGLRSRTYSVTGSGGRVGRKYRGAVLRSLGAIRTQFDAGAIGDTLDVRYPFLARPIVEFALRLPAELCAQPHARKWVLREAMRGILPEPVRTRVGKGGSTDLLVRSLTAQREVLEPLIRAPMLTELGIVDGERLRLAFEAAPSGAYGDRNLSSDVQQSLMVEAWLQIRSGRWSPGPS